MSRKKQWRNVLAYFRFFELNFYYFLLVVFTFAFKICGLELILILLLYNDIQSMHLTHNLLGKTLIMSFIFLTKCFVSL